MTIQYVSGDLFVNRYNVEAFAHGCNCKGAMGAGIAKGFKQRYPHMYEEYKSRCRKQPREFNPGDSFLWKEEGQPSVFNLGTQEHYWRCRASYQAIEQALKSMKRQADEEDIRTIAMPRIGAGYGSLAWERVKAIIERVFNDWPGRLLLSVFSMIGREHFTFTKNTSPENSGI